MRINKLFRTHKRRKYPIQYDQRGKSQREQCFESFDQGLRPMEVVEELGIKKSTVKTYFQQWNQRGKDFDKIYAYVKQLIKPDSPHRDRTLDLLTRVCEVSREEFETILCKPHGLKRLMTGKLYLPGHQKADHVRYSALEFAFYVYDYIENKGGELVDGINAFFRLMQQAGDYRQKMEVLINDENEEIAFTRKILEEFAKQPLRDRLTKKEINQIMGIALETGLLDAERAYWSRIANLITGDGLTMTQARERIYQDLVDKGDIEGAKMIRAYQDRIHPLPRKNRSRDRKMK
jgi:hypothetical protein